MRNFLIAAAMIGMVGIVGAANAATWSAYTFGPSGRLPNVQGLQRVIKGIEKATDGKIRIRLHLAGSLPIKSTNITQAVGSGVIKFADDGFFQGNVPVTGLLRLPMLLHSPAEFHKAVKVMEPYVRKGFEKQGVVVLGHYFFPFQVAFSTKKLTELSDFKGQKMRVSSAQQAAFVKQFGGIPITMGAPEVPPALQRGTIDGVLTASAGGGKIWGDMLKYNYRIPVNYFDAVYIVNKSAFDQLTPEMQAKIRQVVTDLASKTTARIFKEESEVTANLKSHGMVITQASDAEIKKATQAMAPYWEAWAKDHGPDAVEALAEVRKAVGH